MKKILVVLLTLGMLCGCQNKKDDNVVKIGVIAPLTGFASLPGEMCVKGLEIAKQDKDLNFEYVISDCKSSTIDAISAYRNLYNRGIRYFIVCGGQFAMAVAPQTKDDDVIMFATATANIDLLNVTNRCFRVFPHPNCVIDELVNFSLDKFKNKNVAIIYFQNDAYALYADLFEQKIEQSSGKIVLKEGYSANLNDFKSIVAKIAESSPDYIYLSSMGESMLMLTRQLLSDPRTSGIPILGDMNYSLPSAKIVIPQTDTPIFYVDAEINDDFKEKYAQIFQQSANAYSYYAYVIPNILSNVLAKCDGQILDQIDYIKKSNFEIASQAVSFDSSGEANLVLRIYSLY